MLWFSTYSVHSRHVSQFSRENAFAGMLRMFRPRWRADEHGFKICHNLKLALVLNGKRTERSETTTKNDWGTQYLLQPIACLTLPQVQTGCSCLLPDGCAVFIFPIYLTYPVKAFFFPPISQIGIHYHTVPESHSGDVRISSDECPFSSFVVRVETSCTS